jgi:RNA polymerase sigma-70 factor (ECF subfamily)
VTEKEGIYCELLVLRCRQGQRAALEELVRTWERPLFYFVRRLIDDEDEARQVLQQSWVSVLQGLGSLRQPRKLPAWLYSIARKTALTHLRDRYGEQAASRESEAAAPADAPDAQLEFDDAEQIHYGLARLSLLHREVLTLFFLQDLSIDEIAGVLEVPVGTVKSRLHNGKRALKAVLEREASRHE